MDERRARSPARSTTIRQKLKLVKVKMGRGKTYFVVVVIGKLGSQYLACQDTGLESPGASDVAHRITPATHDQSRQVKALHEVNAVGVTSHAEVETSQAVARQAVATALENNGLRPVPLHDSLDDRLEDTLVGDIVNAIAEREVDGIVFSLANANVAQFASAGEVLSVLVEGDRHDTVRGVECLLDAIAMMDINIDIENTLLESQQLQDTEDNIYMLSARGRAFSGPGADPTHHSHSRNRSPRSSSHGADHRPS